MRSIMAISLVIVITLMLTVILAFSPTIQHFRERQALIKAVASGDTTLLHKLLDQGASPNTYLWNSQRRRKSLLMLAAERGDLEAVTMIHEYGGNVHVTEVTGDNILVTIMNEERQSPGHLQCFEYLAAIPSVASKANSNGRTPLQFAVQFHLPLRFIEILLNNRADVNHVEPNHGPPLFGLAADPLNRTPRVDADKVQIARLLLEQGADVNWVSSAGKTALDMAVIRGRSELAAELLAHGGKHGESIRAGSTE